MALAAEVMVRIAANAKRFEREVKRAEDRLNRMADKIRDIGTVARTSLVGLVPAIAPIGAVAVGAAGAMAAAFGAAGAAVAGFGAVAVSNLNDVFEASEDIVKINERIEKAQAMGDMKKVNKLMEERAAIMETLSDNQQRAAVALAEFRSFWEDFTKSFETETVNMFIISLNVLKNLLTAFKPVVEAAYDAIGDLLDSFEGGVSPEFQQFFDWMAAQAGPAIISFGTAAGNVFRGVMHLMMAFTPIMEDVQNGLVGMTQGFYEWAKSLKTSSGFQRFLAYVKENGPKVVGVLKNIAGVAKQALIALAPVGDLILTVLDKATAKIEQILNQFNVNFGPLFRKLVAGIKSGDPQIISIAILDIINRAISIMESLVGQINWGGVARLFAQGFSQLVQHAGIIIPVLVDGLTRIIHQIPWGTIGQVLGEQAGVIVPALLNALGMIINSVAANIGTLTPALANLALSFALEFIGALLDPTVWWQVFKEHWLSLLLLILSPAKIVKPIVAILKKIPIVGTLLAWLVGGLNQLGGPARGKVKERFDDILKGAKDGFAQRWPTIREWLKKQALELAGWLRDQAAERFKKAASRWKDKLLDGLENLPSRLLKAGKNAVQEFVDGLLSKLGSVESAARRIAQKVADFIGFRSPTKEGPGRYADEWAPNFIRMFAAGLIRGVSVVENAVRRIASILHVPFQTMTKRVETSLKGTHDVIRKYLQAILEDGDYMNDWLTHMPRSIADPLRKYFQAIREDGDWMNDWITHLPKNIRDAVRTVGQIVAPWLEGGGNPPWIRQTLPEVYQGQATSGSTYNITVNARTADIDEREMMRVLRRMEMLA